MSNEIRTVIMQAWAFMTKRIAAGAYAPLGTRAWRQAAAAVDRAARTGDVVATQAACRAWWGLLANTPLREGQTCTIEMETVEEKAQGRQPQRGTQRRRAGDVAYTALSPHFPTQREE